MATWEEMSLDCLRAAKLLLDAGFLRRSISGSYYAAYSAVAGELAVRGASFAHGWNNPGHEQLPELILNNLGLPRNSRYNLNKAIRRLRMAREDADYRPGVTIDRSRALDCIHDATDVLQILEIKEDNDD